MYKPDARVIYTVEEDIALEAVFKKYVGSKKKGNPEKVCIYVFNHYVTDKCCDMINYLSNSLKTISGLLHYNFY